MPQHPSDLEPLEPVAMESSCIVFRCYIATDPKPFKILVPLHLTYPFCQFFQVTPEVSFTVDELVQLTERIQNAGTEVVNAKAGTASPYNKILFCTYIHTFIYTGFLLHTMKCVFPPLLLNVS